jgi:hypothetical protein
VFEIHSFIGTLHPHLGKFPPLELAIDEHLLPPILENPNPKTMKLNGVKATRIRNGDD